jgi:hypothetical protein
MRRLSVFLAVALLAFCSAIAVAPVRAIAADGVSDHRSNQSAEYAETARAGGIDHAVTYRDMQSPAADGSGTFIPRPEPQSQSVEFLADLDPEGLSFVEWMIVAALAAFIAFLIWKYGGAFHWERLGKADIGARPSLSKPSTSAPEDGPPLGLDALARMGAGDSAAREEALVRLVDLVLRRVLSWHGADLRHSVTTREALRAVPGTSPWRAPLLDIVLGAERVRFGGWPLSQPAFERYLTAARAILDERANRPGDVA